VTDSDQATADVVEISCAQRIEQLMRHRIDHYVAGRSDPSIYQSVRNMSQFVSDDYGNRFLIELIQNAHDAHDASRSDGEIAVVVDGNDGHGCLYVANRGRGFVEANLKAITNIALSSKPVNAGIGNKGLGFRSVLQVCNWPEIYSVDGDGGSGRFDGFCFRFATLEDLQKHVPGRSASLAAEMERNLPCWHVPVPVAPGERVARFAQEGFATVVRLPLKSKDALDTVRAQVEALLSLKTPLQLFLERIRGISIDDGSGCPVLMDRVVLDRQSFEPERFTADSPIVVEHLRLGATEFVAAHWETDEADFKEALAESLEKGEVPEGWNSWEGRATVSVAVPLGAPLETGTLYCFLPLGAEGKAPFAGYINANFYTKMDRRSVDTSIQLNEFFMKMAAWLSCQLIGFLVKSKLEHAPGAVVSLLCWDDDYVDQIGHSMGEDGKGILSRPFLPTRGPDGSVLWAPPSETYSWVSPPGGCLSPRNVSDIGKGVILVDTLTDGQRKALDRVFVSLRSAGFEPPPDVIATWVERVAHQMYVDGAAPERWATFYDEVASRLALHPAALFGKKFLLSASGELISSELPSTGPTGRGRRAADVYFAPVMSVDADVDDDDSKKSLPLERLPATLRKGFALLSREVPWLKEDGGYRPGRSFLIAGKLAREYDTRDVLRTLASVTRSSGAERSREQALEWAFRLWNSGRSLSDKETRAANFCVPTSGGWIDAETAMFGSGWDVPNGRNLHSLLRATEEQSEDMKTCMSRLLVAHSVWPVRHGSQSDWITFLLAAGVADCMRPIGGETVLAQVTDKPPSLPGAIAQRFSGLDESTRAFLRTRLAAECSANMFSSRPYRADLRDWRMPGQGEHSEFAMDVRREYAVQVLLAMRLVTDDHRTFRAVRADSGAESRRLATPLYAFLIGGSWLPVNRPGGAVRFVKPSEAWYFHADDERPPRFMDFVLPVASNAMDPATFKWLRDHASLGVFNEESQSARVIAALTAAAAAGISDIQDMRRFHEVFARAWIGTRKSGRPGPMQSVPVSMGQVIGVISRSDPDDAPGGHFDDGQDVLKKQLLRELGEPVFDFVQGDSESAWVWVDACVPGRFRRISEEPAEIYIDGARFDDMTPVQPLIEEVGSWIVDFLVFVAEHKSSLFARQTQKTLARVRRAAKALSLVRGKRVEFAHGEHRVALAPAMRDALAVQGPTGPVLIIQTEDDAVSLGLLARSSGQLAAALGSRELAHGLDSALLRLAGQMPADSSGAPDDADIAAALGVAADDIKQTRQFASADLASLLFLAIPLAACIADFELAATLQKLSLRDDPPEEELREGLAALSAAAGLTLKALEDRLVPLADLSQLMAEFSLPISTLNSVVAELGGNYRPVSNERPHRDAWLRHLRQRQPATLERLRQRVAGLFDQRGSLAEYAAARDEVLSIAPDSAWFTTQDTLSDELMDAWIEAWVVARLVDSPPDAKLDAELMEARAANGATLREFWSKFAPLLSAWVRTPHSTAAASVRQAWASPEATRDGCLAQAKAAGWLDFRLLDEGQVAHWLTAAGVWPEGRKPDANPAVWGISPESVLSSEERAKAERAEQQLRRTQVDFAGSKVSALADGFAKIAAAVKEAARHAPSLAHIPTGDAELAPMDPVRPGGGPGGPGGNSLPKSPESSMSEDQKLAVGLIGEAWAREWLRRRYGLESVGENIWVSRYRDAVLNTTGGSDSLGYDFVYATKSRSYYFEVKASTGDPLRFELGPTEIFAAQRYRADREHQYRILYLANVADPVRMRWLLLPNPFSAKASASFRAVGKGSVVYEFDTVRRV
jgi:hypothetical protein